jgi:riboflavin biosynthesis pyrimidine reductase
VITGPDVSNQWRQRLQEQGHKSIEALLDAHGQFHLPSLLQKLFCMGIHGLLIEGGATTRQHFIAQDLLNSADVVLAPCTFSNKRMTWQPHGMTETHHDVIHHYQRKEKLCLQA